MKTNWKTHGNPFLNFTEELTQEWILQGFSQNQTQDWLGIGIKATDAYFCSWLRDIKNLDSDYVLNYGDSKTLRKEYKDWQLETLVNLNVPTNEPTNFSWKPVIITIFAGLGIYLIIRNYE